MLEHLESFSAKRLEDFEKELPEERRRYWGRIKGILTEHEELKRGLAIEKKSREEMRMHLDRIEGLHIEREALKVS